MDIPEGEPRYIDGVLQIPTREEPLTTVEDGVWDPAEHGQKLVALTDAKWQTVLDLFRHMAEVEFDTTPGAEATGDQLSDNRRDHDQVTEEYRQIRDEIENQLAY